MAWGWCGCMGSSPEASRGGQIVAMVSKAELTEVPGRPRGFSRESGPRGCFCLWRDCSWASQWPVVLGCPLRQGAVSSLAESPEGRRVSGRTTHSFTSHVESLRHQPGQLSTVSRGARAGPA